MACARPWTSIIPQCSPFRRPPPNILLSKDLCLPPSSIAVFWASIRVFSTPSKYTSIPKFWARKVPWFSTASRTRTRQENMSQCNFNHLPEHEHLSSDQTRSRIFVWPQHKQTIWSYIIFLYQHRYNEKNINSRFYLNINQPIKAENVYCLSIINKQIKSKILFLPQDQALTSTRYPTRPELLFCFPNPTRTTFKKFRVSGFSQQAVSQQAASNLLTIILKFCCFLVALTRNPLFNWFMMRYTLQAE